jgi:hypothetical protein
MAQLRWGVLGLLIWALTGCNQQEVAVMEEVEDDQWASRFVSIAPKRPEPVAVGQTVKLTATVALLDDTQVEWVSRNPEVATVDQAGTVRAKSPGITKITAISRAKPVARSTATVQVLGQASSPSNPSDPSLQPLSYAASSEDFPNPERGFTVFSLLDYPDPARLQELHRQGYRLLRSDVLLDRWRSSNLPQDFLNRLNQGFAQMRQAGFKTVPRFMYNSPAVGSNYGLAQDTSLSWVLTHIKQLEPVLRRNADVIAVLQGGFIGAWGEWHTSSNGLTSFQNKTTILNALLAMLPTERMVQVRYVGDLTERYSTPLSAGEAHSGSAKSRTGLVNNCLLANDSDAGTYAASQLIAHKDYLARTSSYMAIGGETCEVNAASNRAACNIALPELARFHWSHLNSLFYRPVLNRWKAEGCYSEISRRLGYRLRLSRAELPQEAGRGGVVRVVLNMVNEGFAAPHNPRALELVLRHRTSGQLTRLELPADPRFWLPGSHTIDVETTLPQNTATGDHELLLALPDPASALYARPDYAIRLANQGLWEDKTGFNKLLHSVRVN